MIPARGNLGVVLFLIPALLEKGSGVASDRRRVAGPPEARRRRAGCLLPRLRPCPSSVPPPVGRGAHLVTAHTPRRCRSPCLRVGNALEHLGVGPQGKDPWARVGDEFRPLLGSDQLQVPTCHFPIALRGGRGATALPRRLGPPVAHVVHGPFSRLCSRPPRAPLPGTVEGRAGDGEDDLFQGDRAGSCGC